MKSKMISLIIVLALVMAFSTSIALAADESVDKQAKKEISQEAVNAPNYQISNENRSSDNQKEQLIKAHEKATSSLSSCTVWDDEGWIGINKPTPGTIFYYGNGYIESMWTDVTCYDTWEYYYTRPGYAVFDEYDNLVIDFDGDETVDVDSSDHYTGYISLEDLDEGIYEFWAWAIPCYSDGSFVEDWSDWDVPSTYVQFKVEKLAAPKGVKAKAGKKKVTISYKKAKGAQKYQIYRSTSKYGSFTRIATTSSTKYVDKKVKKGKMYYYKVRSYRPKTDIDSSFSSVAKSGKVK